LDLGIRSQGRRDRVRFVDRLQKIIPPSPSPETFLVECQAGEAGVPVVRLKNFRDRWVGSSEGNLENIFRLLAALGRCYVFIDEADQALGRRGAGAGDGGVSGRPYSMIAEEDFSRVEAALPLLLTPAAAETIAVKVYRLVRTRDITPLEALEQCLTDYRAPVASAIIEAQIRLAMDEATDPGLIPAYFRDTYPADPDP